MGLATELILMLANSQRQVMMGKGCDFKVDSLITMLTHKCSAEKMGKAKTKKGAFHRGWENVITASAAR